MRREKCLISSLPWSRLKLKCEVVPGALMGHRQSSHLGCSVIASFLLTSCLTGDGLFAWAQVDAQTTVDSSVNHRVYEIVSIKPDKPGTLGGSMQILLNGFRDTGVYLATVVRGAYDGIIMQSQVVGMPAWAESEPYDVEARVDSDTAEAWKKLSPKERWNQEQPMLQALLADPCQFRVHRETKEMPVYDLVIAKGGLKIKEAAPEEQSFEQMSGQRLTVHTMAIDSLVYSFAGTDGRLIVDKTGLGEKKFDFDLTWTPDNRRATADSGPPLFTALEEQLGLKLVPSKGQVNVLVIDQMERPSPN